METQQVIKWYDLDQENVVITLFADKLYKDRKAHFAELFKCFFSNPKINHSFRKYTPQQQLRFFKTKPLYFEVRSETVYLQNGFLKPSGDVYPKISCAVNFLLRCFDTLHYLDVKKVIMFIFDDIARYIYKVSFENERALVRTIPNVVFGDSGEMKLATPCEMRTEHVTLDDKMLLAMVCYLVLYGRTFREHLLEKIRSIAPLEFESLFNGSAAKQWNFLEEHIEYFRISGNEVVQLYEHYASFSYDYQRSVSEGPPFCRGRNNPSHSCHTRVSKENFPGPLHSCHTRGSKENFPGPPRKRSKEDSNLGLNRKFCSAVQFLLSCFEQLHYLELTESICFVLRDVGAYLLGMSSSARKNAFGRIPSTAMDELGFLQLSRSTPEATTKKNCFRLDLNVVSKDDLLLLFIVYFLSLNGRTHFEVVIKDVRNRAPQVVSMILTSTSTPGQLAYLKRHREYFRTDDEFYLELPSTFVLPVGSSSSGDSSDDARSLSDVDDMADRGHRSLENGIDGMSDGFESRTSSGTETDEVSWSAENGASCSYVNRGDESSCGFVNGDTRLHEEVTGGDTRLHELSLFRDSVSPCSLVNEGDARSFRTGRPNNEVSSSFSNDINASSRSRENSTNRFATSGDFHGVGSEPNYSGENGHSKSDNISLSEEYWNWKNGNYDQKETLETDDLSQSQNCSDVDESGWKCVKGKNPAQTNTNESVSAISPVKAKKMSEKLLFATFYLSKFFKLPDRRQSLQVILHVLGDVSDYFSSLSYENKLSLIQGSFAVCIIKRRLVPLPAGNALILNQQEKQLLYFCYSTHFRGKSYFEKLYDEFFKVNKCSPLLKTYSDKLMYFKNLKNFFVVDKDGYVKCCRLRDLKVDRDFFYKVFALYNSATSQLKVSSLGKKSNCATAVKDNKNAANGTHSRDLDASTNTRIVKHNTPDSNSSYVLVKAEDIQYCRTSCGKLKENRFALLETNDTPDRDVEIVSSSFEAQVSRYKDNLAYKKLCESVLFLLTSFGTLHYTILIKYTMHVLDDVDAWFKTLSYEEQREVFSSIPSTTLTDDCLQLTKPCKCDMEYTSRKKLRMLYILTYLAVNGKTHVSELLKELYQNVPELTISNFTGPKDPSWFGLLRQFKCFELSSRLTLSLSPLVTDGPKRASLDSMESDTVQKEFDASIADQKDCLNQCHHPNNETLDQIPSRSPDECNDLSEDTSQCFPTEVLDRKPKFSSALPSLPCIAEENISKQDEDKEILNNNIEPKAPQYNGSIVSEPISGESFTNTRPIEDGKTKASKLTKLKRTRSVSFSKEVKNGAHEFVERIVLKKEFDLKSSPCIAEENISKQDEDKEILNIEPIAPQNNGSIVSEPIESGESFTNTRPIEDGKTKTSKLTKLKRTRSVSFSKEVKNGAHEFVERIVLKKEFDLKSSPCIAEENISKQDEDKEILNIEPIAPQNNGSIVSEPIESGESFTNTRPIEDGKTKTSKLTKLKRTRSVSFSKEVKNGAHEFVERIVLKKEFDLKSSPCIAEENISKQDEDKEILNIEPIAPQNNGSIVSEPIASGESFSNTRLNEDFKIKTSKLMKLKRTRSVSFTKEVKNDVHELVERSVLKKEELDSKSSISSAMLTLLNAEEDDIESCKSTKVEGVLEPGSKVCCFSNSTVSNKEKSDIAYDAVETKKKLRRKLKSNKKVAASGKAFPGTENIPNSETEVLNTKLIENKAVLLDDSNTSSGLIVFGKEIPNFKPLQSRFDFNMTSKPLIDTVSILHPNQDSKETGLTKTEIPDLKCFNDSHNSNSMQPNYFWLMQVLPDHIKEKPTSEVDATLNVIQHNSDSSNKLCSKQESDLDQDIDQVDTTKKCGNEMAKVTSDSLRDVCQNSLVSKTPRSSPSSLLKKLRNLNSQKSPPNFANKQTALVNMPSNKMVTDAMLKSRANNTAGMPSDTDNRLFTKKSELGCDAIPTSDASILVEKSPGSTNTEEIKINIDAACNSVSANVAKNTSYLVATKIEESIDKMGNSNVTNVTEMTSGLDKDMTTEETEVNADATSSSAFGNKSEKPSGVNIVTEKVESKIIAQCNADIDNVFEKSSAFDTVTEKSKVNADTVSNFGISHVTQEIIDKAHNSDATNEALKIPASIKSKSYVAKVNDVAMYSSNITTADNGLVPKKTDVVINTVSDSGSTGVTESNINKTMSTNKDEENTASASVVAEKFSTTNKCKITEETKLNSFVPFNSEISNVEETSALKKCVITQKTQMNTISTSEIAVLNEELSSTAKSRISDNPHTDSGAISSCDAYVTDKPLGSGIAVIAEEAKVSATPESEITSVECQKLVPKKVDIPEKIFIRMKKGVEFLLNHFECFPDLNLVTVVLHALYEARYAFLLLPDSDQIKLVKRVCDAGSSSSDTVGHPSSTFELSGEQKSLLLYSYVLSQSPKMHYRDIPLMFKKKELITPIDVVQTWSFLKDKSSFFAVDSRGYVKLKGFPSIKWKPEFYLSDLCIQEKSNVIVESQIVDKERSSVEGTAVKGKEKITATQTEKTTEENKFINVEGISQGRSTVEEFAKLTDIVEAKSKKDAHGSISVDQKEKFIVTEATKKTKDKCTKEKCNTQRVTEPTKETKIANKTVPLNENKTSMQIIQIPSEKTERFAVSKDAERKSSRETSSGKRVEDYKDLEKTKTEQVNNQTPTLMQDLSESLHDSIVYLMQHFELRANTWFLEVALHVVEGCAPFFELSHLQQQEVIKTSLRHFRINKQQMISNPYSQDQKIFKLKWGEKELLCLSYILRQSGRMHYREVFKKYEECVGQKVLLSDSDQIWFFKGRDDLFFVAISGYVNLVNVPVIKLDFKSVLGLDVPCDPSAAKTVASDNAPKSSSMAKDLKTPKRPPVAKPIQSTTKNQIFPEKRLEENDDLSSDALNACRLTECSADKNQSAKDLAKESDLSLHYQDTECTLKSQIWYSSEMKCRFTLLFIKRIKESIIFLSMSFKEVSSQQIIQTILNVLHDVRSCLVDETYFYCDMLKEINSYFESQRPMFKQEEGHIEKFDSLSEEEKDLLVLICILVASGPMHHEELFKHFEAHGRDIKKTTSGDCYRYLEKQRRYFALNGRGDVILSKNPILDGLSECIEDLELRMSFQKAILEGGGSETMAKKATNKKKYRNAGWIGNEVMYRILEFCNNILASSRNRQSHNEPLQNKVESKNLKNMSLVGENTLEDETADPCDDSNSDSKPSWVNSYLALKKADLFPLRSRKHMKSHSGETLPCTDTKATSEIRRSDVQHFRDVAKNTNTCDKDLTSCLGLSGSVMPVGMCHQSDVSSLTTTNQCNSKEIKLPNVSIKDNKNKTLPIACDNTSTALNCNDAPKNKSKHDNILSFLMSPSKNTDSNSVSNDCGTSQTSLLQGMPITSPCLMSKAKKLFAMSSSKKDNTNRSRTNESSVAIPNERKSSNISDDTAMSSSKKDYPNHSRTNDSNVSIPNERKSSNTSDDTAMSSSKKDYPNHSRTNESSVANPNERKSSNTSDDTAMSSSKKDYPNHSRTNDSSLDIPNERKSSNTCDDTAMSSSKKDYPNHSRTNDTSVSIPNERKSSNTSDDTAMSSSKKDYPNHSRTNDTSVSIPNERKSSNTSDDTAMSSSKKDYPNHSRTNDTSVSIPNERKSSNTSDDTAMSSSKKDYPNHSRTNDSSVSIPNERKSPNTSDDTAMSSSKKDYPNHSRTNDSSLDIPNERKSSNTSDDTAMSSSKKDYPNHSRTNDSSLDIPNERKSSNTCDDTAMSSSKKDYPNHSRTNDTSVSIPNERKSSNTSDDTAMSSSKKDYPNHSRTNDSSVSIPNERKSPNTCDDTAMSSSKKDYPNHRTNNSSVANPNERKFSDTSDDPANNQKISLLGKNKTNSGETVARLKVSSDCSCTKDASKELKTLNFFVSVLCQSRGGLTIHNLEDRLQSAPIDVQHYIACLYKNNIRNYLLNHATFYISPTSNIVYWRR